MVSWSTEALVLDGFETGSGRFASHHHVPLHVVRLSGVVHPSVRVATHPERATRNTLNPQSKKDSASSVVSALIVVTSTVGSSETPAELTGPELAPSLMLPSLGGIS